MGVAQQRAVVLVLDHAQQLGRRAGGIRHEAALAQLALAGVGSGLGLGLGVGVRVGLRLGLR